MPAIVYDFPEIRRAMRGDDWWTPTGRPLEWGPNDWTDYSTFEKLEAGGDGPAPGPEAVA